MPLKFNNLLFLKSVLMSNFSRLRFPLKISYAVTYKCNLSCKMCNIWKKAPCQGELTVNDLDKFFKNTHKFYWVGITGGEPFLRPDLSEVIDVILYYCGRLSALHFATNGQLTDRIVDLAGHIRKKNSRVKIVFTISIDGPPKLHNYIRGSSGAWQNAINTFTRLKDMRFVKPHIGFTISHHNIGSFEDAFASLREVYPGLRFDDINVNIFQKSSFYYENQDMQGFDSDKLANETARILGMDKDTFTINNFLRRRYLKLYPAYARTKRYPVKCQALSSTCFLDPCGNLFPCAVYNKKLLNIKDMREGLGSIWNKRDAKNLSLECSGNKCPSCWSPCDAYSAIGGSLFKAAA